MNAIYPLIYSFSSYLRLAVNFLLKIYPFVKDPNSIDVSVRFQLLDEVLAVTTYGTLQGKLIITPALLKKKVSPNSCHNLRLAVIPVQ